MKNFVLDVDIIMSKRVRIKAENEEQAKSIFNEEVKKNPYNFAHSFNAIIGHKIIDVTED